MPRRSKIQYSPPCNIPRHNGPSLLWRPGPSTVNWTHKRSTPLYILFVISLDWLNEFPFPLKEIYMVKIRAGWHLIKLWTSHELIRTCKVSHCGNYFSTMVKNQFPPQWKSIYRAPWKFIFTTVTLSLDWLAFAVKLVWRAAEPGKLIFTALKIEFYHGWNWFLPL